MDCSDPTMYNNLACLDQFFGSAWAKGVKDKWNSWFHKNESTTTPSSPTPTTPTTTSSPTSISPTPLPITNKTTEVISDLYLQDAPDGLEFFKIYNDFMLAKLASKLSQDAHERQMLHMAQNPEENTVSNPTQTPLVPDFSRINENDIAVLKKLDSCLKNEQPVTNVDGSVPITKSDDVEGTVDGATNDRRGIYERYLHRN